MMKAHIPGAGDDLHARVKAAAKYGARILLAEQLAEVGTRPREAESPLAVFAQSRWAVFKGEVNGRIRRRLSACRSVAAGRAYCTILQATPTVSLQVIGAGRYTDRYERRDGDWYFARRRSSLDLRGHFTDFRHSE